MRAGLLEVFASNRMPQGSIAHHNDGRASTRLFADDLADLKSAAAAQGLTWQAAHRAERSGVTSTLRVAGMSRAAIGGPCKSLIMLATLDNHRDFRLRGFIAHRGTQRI